MIDKGILAIGILALGKSFVITNTHTTVGWGLYHTESDEANSIRGEQLLQTISLTHSFKTDFRVILGDFNAGPDVSEPNYQLLLDSNFIDSYLLVCSDGCDDVTWHPANKLNNKGHFPDSPPQRIDNIFIVADGLKDLEIVKGGVILKEEVLKIGNASYSISDHYGYYCILNLK